MRIEGTDFPSTMWQPIAHKLGEAAIEEEKNGCQKWENGQYNSYLEWVKETIEIHRKYGLTQGVFNELIRTAEYNEGVVEFFDQLDRSEYIPVLISGGFQELIRRAENDLGIEYGFGACEYFFDDRDGFLKSYNLQPSDFEGKIRFLKLLLSSFGLNEKKDWIFVGDGKNDKQIASLAPIAFGISPHKHLQNVDNLIEIKSFLDILPRLEQLSRSEQEVAVPSTNGIETLRQTSDTKTSREAQTLEAKYLQAERTVRVLRQKLNDLKGRQEKKDRLCVVPISELDYKTPRIRLQTLLDMMKEKQRNVTLLGFDENSEVFRRVKGIENLRVIPGMKKIDNSVIRNSSFLFIYKDCITHSDVWHACSSGDTPPCCFLKHHVKEDMLETAMANVLYRFFYE